MTTVLITRPLQDAKRLAAALTAHGYECLNAPMLAIEPTHEKMPEAHFDGLILTSRNSVRHAGAALSALKSLPCYCVGAQTAELAREFGLSVKIAAENGGKLAEAMMQNVSVASSFLHPCGRHLSEEPATSLEAAGLSITHWPVYEALASTHMPETASTALRDNHIAAVLFYSPRTAALFAKLARHEGLEACCARLRAICLSKAVADEISAISWQNIHIADRPDEQSMIEALRRFCPPA